MLRMLALIALAPAVVHAKTTVSHSADAGDRPVETTEAAQVVIGTPGTDLAITRARVVVDPDQLVVRVVLTIHTDAKERRQAQVPIALSPGTRIIGAAIEIGNMEPTLAIAVAPHTARDDYQQLFMVQKDPLLVEQVRAEHEHAIANDAIDEELATRTASAFLPVRAPVGPSHFTSYMVRAFPLDERDDARISLTLALPAGTTRVVFDAREQPLPRVDVHIPADVMRPYRTHNAVDRPFAIPTSGSRLVTSTTVVDPTHSLFAGAVDVGTPLVSPSPPTVQYNSDLDKTTIRRVIKLHIARLARCYSRAIEYRGGPEGTAVMHFMIDTDGSTVGTKITGEIEDPQITSCLAAEAKTMQFPPSYVAVIVHYPLHLRVARH